MGEVKDIEKEMQSEEKVREMLRYCEENVR